MHTEPTSIETSDVSMYLGANATQERRLAPHQRCMMPCFQISNSSKNKSFAECRILETFAWWAKNIDSTMDLWGPMRRDQWHSHVGKKIVMCAWFTMILQKYFIATVEDGLCLKTFLGYAFIWLHFNYLGSCEWCTHWICTVLLLLLPLPRPLTWWPKWGTWLHICSKLLISLLGATSVLGKLWI